MHHTYSECKVVLSNTGELLLALPVYAGGNSAIFDEEQLETLIGLKANIGIYEKLGYLLYHPSQEFSFYMNSLEAFEDLGLL